jgi:hypothetical protein
MLQDRSADPAPDGLREVALLRYAACVVCRSPRVIGHWADERLTPEALDRVSAALGKALRKGGGRG